MSSAANAVGPMLNKSYPVTMLSKIPAAIMSSPVDTTVLMSPIRNFMAMTASTRTTARRTMLKAHDILIQCCSFNAFGNLFKQPFWSICYETDARSR